MFVAPHPPFDIPEPWYSQVDRMDLPENVGSWYPGQSPLQLYNFPGFAGARCSRSDWERIWPVYGGLVALLDHCIGKIISELKKEGLYDDSIIIFSSDHGEMLGSHCLFQKMCMYEEATHIPLMVKIPKGMEQVGKSDEIVSLIDVLPTLGDLLGMDMPPAIQGVSLLPCIREGNKLQREHVFLQFDGNGARGNFQRAIMKDRYKLIVDLFKDEIFFELYDVIADPQERENLAYEEPAKVRSFFEILRFHMESTDDMIRFDSSDYERFLKNTEPLRESIRGFTKTDWC
jgi:arylsulfatase A-like enzyme